MMNLPDMCITPDKSDFINNLTCNKNSSNYNINTPTHLIKTPLCYKKYDEFLK
jgi:hypothetical protein